MPHLSPKCPKICPPRNLSVKCIPKCLPQIPEISPNSSPQMTPTSPKNVLPKKKKIPECSPRLLSKCQYISRKPLLNIILSNEPTQNWSPKPSRQTPSKSSRVPFCSQTCLPKQAQVSSDVQPAASAPSPHCRSVPGSGAGGPGLAQPGAGRGGPGRGEQGPEPRPLPRPLPWPYRAGGGGAHAQLLHGGQGARCPARCSGRPPGRGGGEGGPEGGAGAPAGGAGGGRRAGREGAGGRARRDPEGRTGGGRREGLEGRAGRGWGRG